MWIIGIFLVFAISSIGLIFEDSFAQTGFSLTSSDSLTDDETLELAGAYGITSFTINSKTYIAVTAERDNGIQIIDVSDPANISATDSLADNDMFDLDSPFGITSFTINSKTYVAVTGLVDNIVQIIDVSDPANISATDSLTDTETLQLAGAVGITSFTINSKTYVAVAAQNDNGIQIIDVSDPANISATDSLTDNDMFDLDSPFGITSFTINSKTYVGVASYTDGIQIIDVSDPANISTTGSLPITAGAYGITSFVVNSKTYVGVATRLGGGVQIIDVSDPANISTTDSLMDDRTLKLATASGITSFTIGSKTYVGVAARLDDGVQIIDVSDPANISTIYSLTDTTSLELDGASGITSFTIGSKTYVGVTGTIDDGVQILGVDRALIADAGPDQNVALGATVTLDGTGSTYTDGGTITYSWAKPADSLITLTNPTTAKPTFTAPTTAGPITFTLTVSAGGLTDKDTVTINVSDAPVADAGDDQTVAYGTTVTLDGTGSSDPHGGTLTYSWAKPADSLITLTNPTTAKPTFTAPSSTERITFTLTVSARTLTGTDTVTINVSNAPVADAGDDQIIAPGTTVTLDGSSSMDSDGDPLSYAWTVPAGSGVTLVNANTASPTFTAPTTAGPILFTLAVSAGGLTDTDTVTITVSNQSPTANAGDDQTVAPGATVTLSGSGTDPNGDSLSYSWERTSGTSVSLTGGNTQQPTFTAPTSHGSILFTLTVSDGTNSATDTVTITVSNQSPTANAGDDQTVAPGATVTLSGSGTDPNGDSLSYSWERTSGTSVSLTGGNTQQPTFTAPTSHGSILFTLTVSDGTNSATDTVTITVSNQSPTANAGDDQTVAPGATVTLSGSGTDPNGDSLSYSWARTSGTSVSLTGGNTQQPTFTAPTSHGSILFTLTVSDGTNSATDTVTITVSNQSPTANAGDDQTVAPGATVTLSGSGTDPNGDSLSYSWTKPTDSTVLLSNPTTTSPTFTAPTTTGNIIFTLIVSDGANSVSDTVTITVTSGPIAPIAHAGHDQKVAFGETVTLDGSRSSDPDGGTITYLWARTSGLQTMLKNPDSYNPTFVAPSSSGTITFTLTVFDGTLTHSDMVTITVSAPPTADAGPDQTVASGTTVTLDGTASTDPDDATLTYFWSKIKGPDVRLSGESTAQPTFTAPPSSTPITFRLVVSDGASVDNDQVTITTTLQGQPAIQSIQELEDVLVSAEFTGPNTITITYVKAMHTFIDSYLNFTITGEDTARNIVEIQGSPSEKTSAVVYGKKSTVYITTLTFDGDAVPANATGSMHVSIAGYYLAIVTVGGELSIKSL